MRKLYGKKVVVFWTITFLWIGMILSLSSQNGDQTAELSGGLAGWIAELIFRDPSAGQMEQVHMLIRKLAHVVLFLGLGGLSYAAGHVTFHRKGRRRAAAGISAVLILSCAFLDEWHKQFIPGRHFDTGETLLNMCCGIAGIVIAGAVTRVICGGRYKCFREKCND